MNRKTIVEAREINKITGFEEEGIRVTVDTGTDRGLERDSLTVGNARALRDWLNHYLEWQARGPEPEETPE